MPNAKTRIVVVLAILPMLGGCKSLFGQNLFGHANRSSEPAIEQASLVPDDAATQEGRHQLVSGNPGLAIAAFQRALANGEAVAPAANGLGVAYARVGRPDLARRFFEQAIASAPGDPKYIANLDRLIVKNQMDFAYRDAVASAKFAAAAENAGPEDLQKSAAKAETVASVAAQRPMRRVSRGEVVIVTVPPANSARLGRMVAPRGEFIPAVRLEIGRDKIADFRPIVRVKLPESDAVARSNGKLGTAADPGDTAS